MRLSLLIMTVVLCTTLFAPSMRAQETSAAQDSLYALEMNAGYAALRASDTVTAIAAFERAKEHNPGAATPHLQLGYVFLAMNRREAAAVQFEEALARDNEQDTARRQLGYIYADLGRTRQALTTFTWLSQTGRQIPRDYVAMGNLSAALGDFGAAREAFAQARDGNDPAAAADARAGLQRLAAVGVGAGTFVELYLAPFYQDRFDNTVGQGFVRAGVRGGSWWKPSAYLSLRATRDSRSTGGQQPILFNDNTVIPAFGVRVQPGGGGLYLYAEAGAAYDLVDKGDGRNWHRDLRAGTNYNRSLEWLLASASDGVRTVADLSADVSFYERFDRNVIGYAQWRQALRVGGQGGAMFDLYARAWGASDSRGEFFNRVVEGGGGVAVHLPLGGLRTSLYVDVLRGRYLEPPPLDSDLPRSYHDVRVTLTTGLFRFRPFAR